MEIGTAPKGMKGFCQTCKMQRNLANANSKLKANCSFNFSHAAKGEDDRNQTASRSKRNLACIQHGKAHQTAADTGATGGQVHA